jgi:molybdopterin molybdotransferase
MLSVADARRLLLDAVPALGTSDAPLLDSLGLTLAEAILADRDAPPTDRSSMDGFALRADDTRRAGSVLRVIGEIRAGQSADEVVVGAGEAVRIFTGSVIPNGADAVVMVELTEEDRPGGSVRIDEQAEAGQNIRHRGEDRRVGERALEAGTMIRAAEIAALATLGRNRVRIVRRPSVSVLATGDELVPTDRVPARHQIRNSNAPMILAQLHAVGIGARDLGIAPDDPTRLDAAIAAGLEGDVLILTGGVSVGEYDLVGAALARAGCEVLFHQVAMRPGKPILVARRGGTLVLGLPGNPVSAFTGFHVFVAPAVRKMMGREDPVLPTIRATLLERLRRKPGRLTYFLGRLDLRDGKPFVMPIPSTGSGDVLALSAANAFIVAEGDPHAIEAGHEVDVEVWDGSMRHP